MYTVVAFLPLPFSFGFFCVEMSWKVPGYTLQNLAHARTGDRISTMVTQYKRAMCIQVLTSIHEYGCSNNTPFCPSPITHTRVTLYHHPPCTWTPPPWTLDVLRFPRDPPTGGGLDLGLFEKSNRPSRRGGLDFELFRKSNRPSKRVEIP